MFTCLACNVEGTLGQDTACDAFLNILDSKVDRWHVVFISECDGHLHSNHDLSFADHRTYRNHVIGCKPMCFLVNSSVSNCVRTVMWRGRAGAIHLFQRPSASSAGLNIVRHTCCSR